jgi:hypothetical protein
MVAEVPGPAASDLSDSVDTGRIGSLTEEIRQVGGACRPHDDDPLATTPRDILCTRHMS